MADAGGGEVRNTISGGTRQGSVLQGRDFSGLFWSAAQPAPPRGSGPAPKD
jgi:hypothetical protein